MSNVLDLMPRLQAHRDLERGPSTAERVIVGVSNVGEANAQLLASAAALGFAGISEMAAYWLRIGALAEEWSGNSSRPIASRR